MTVVRLLRASILVGLGAATTAACKGDEAAAPTNPPGNTTDAATTPIQQQDANVPYEAGPPGTTHLAPCGDIPPATNHPPFEAIKRLATTSDPVRILVWGQSIALQDWWQQVKTWLQQTYPKGNLIMESHGRGSCSSDCLVGATSWFTDGKTENREPGDVYAWKPDLIMFNVYGDEDDYTYLAHGFVEGCSAFDKYPVATGHCPADNRYPDYKRPEVLLQTDHRLPGTYPKVDPNLKQHNEVFIPQLAQTLGVSWGDVWTKWGAYLDTHEKDANAYLQDTLHLNDKGNVLMAQLVEQDLCYNPVP